LRDKKSTPNVEQGAIVPEMSATLRFRYSSGDGKLSLAMPGRTSMRDMVVEMVEVEGQECKGARLFNTLNYKAVVTP
jgi:hypothetical protein